jgi:hypothetical protein
MTYKKYNKNLLRNADTIVRREWVESAIQCARERLDEPLPIAESGDLGSIGGGFSEHSADSNGPHLELVWDADERRSGT